MQKGNTTHYVDLRFAGPRIRLCSGRSLVLAASMAVILAGGIFLLAHHGPVNLIQAGAALAFIVGLNTVTYESPVTGVVAPTATQSRVAEFVSAVITGDGASTDFTVTHNWGLTAAELAQSFPWVEYEWLSSAGYSAAPIISSKTTNAVAFTNNAFTGAGLRVRLTRPWTPLRNFRGPNQS